jgi:hypothetical protein
MLGMTELEITDSNRGSQRMYHVRLTIQLAALPVFLALAVVSYFQPSPMCTIPGPYGFLTGMWFMYLLMAVAHSPAWFPLVAKALSMPHSKAPPPLDCCAPLLAETPGRQDQHSQTAQFVA